VRGEGGGVIRHDTNVLLDDPDAMQVRVFPGHADSGLQPWVMVDVDDELTLRSHQPKALRDLAAAIVRAAELLEQQQADEATTAVVKEVV
jgi:hypothetical protein